MAMTTVDLRWGVSDETTDDHGTMDLCRSEIDRCISRSAGMAFLFFSGERYGWRALPKFVPREELEGLVALLDDPLAKATALYWYLLDENAVPACYVLRRVSDGEAEGAAVPPGA